MNDDTLSERARRVAAVEGLLFDLDGTLVDTVDLIVRSARHATQVVLGEALPDDVLRHNIGVPLRTQMGEYAPGHVDELLVAYREYNERVHDDLIREYPGTEAALAALRDAGYRMGVVTSKSKSVALRGVEFFGLQTVLGVHRRVRRHHHSQTTGRTGPGRFAASRHSRRALHVRGRQPSRHGCGTSCGRCSRPQQCGGLSPSECLSRSPTTRSRPLADLTRLLGGDEALFRV